MGLFFANIRKNYAIAQNRDKISGFQKSTDKMYFNN